MKPKTNEDQEQFKKLLIEEIGYGRDLFVEVALCEVKGNRFINISKGSVVSGEKWYEKGMGVGVVVLDQLIDALEKVRDEVGRGAKE